MHRRQAWKIFAGLAACPLCASAGLADEHHWSYEGEAGPGRWGGAPSRNAPNADKHSLRLNFGVSYLRCGSEVSHKAQSQHDVTMAGNRNGGTLPCLPKSSFWFWKRSLVMSPIQPNTQMEGRRWSAEQDTFRSNCPKLDRQRGASAGGLFHFEGPRLALGGCTALQPPMSAVCGTAARRASLRDPPTDVPHLEALQHPIPAEQA
jgi:hypothetical protein